MPEMHLRQPRFVYSACDPLTRQKFERIKEFKRTGDTRSLFRQIDGRVRDMIKESNAPYR